MRFGLLNPPAAVKHSSYGSLPQTLPPQLAQPPPTPALELLSETLQKLDLSVILRLSSVSAEAEHDYRKNILAAQKKHFTSSLNTAFDDPLELLRQSVEATIQAHEKFKREEEEKRRVEEEKRKAELLRQKQLEEKLEKERKEKEELEKKRLKEEQERRAKENSRSGKGFTNPTEVENEFLEYLARIPDIKSLVVQELAKQPELKKQVGTFKRKINVRFGQLSNSMNQLRSVTGHLVEAINSCKSEPLAYKWILNFVSKSIVSQAETEVTVKPDAAIPLARLALALLQQVDGLEYYLSARIIKKCSLVIGYSAKLDTEGGRIHMGWKKNDGEWEPEVKFEERIGGILTLWSVMAREGDALNFPLFTKEAQWKFLARVLNTDKKLLLDVHFVVVSNWWEAAAEAFVSSYGQQARKLLQLAATGFAALGSLNSFPAAMRLQILGEDLLQKNIFNTLKDMEP